MPYSIGGIKMKKEKMKWWEFIIPIIMITALIISLII